MFVNCVHVFKRCWVHVWKKGLKTLKCLYGHVECSLDNPAENFLPEVRNFFAESVKTIGK